jgi:hypothetical protein
MCFLKRVAVAAMALLGAGIGWILSSASDVRFTPLMIALVPGLLAGLATFKISGSFFWAIFLSGCFNGLVYGFVTQRLLRSKRP